MCLCILTICYYSYFPFWLGGGRGLDLGSDCFSSWSYFYFKSELKKTTNEIKVRPAKDNHQVSINYLKLHVKAVIESEAWTDAVHLRVQYSLHS